MDTEFWVFRSWCCTNTTCGQKRSDLISNGQTLGRYVRRGSQFELLVRLGQVNVPHGYKQKWKGFIEYMSNTWMDGRYKISEWCCYESEARTNNVSESLNFVTRELFGRHPLYDVWIEKLALQMASHLSRHEQYKIWKKTNKRPNKEILKNEVISNEWLR
eukprot:550732_1